MSHRVAHGDGGHLRWKTVQLQNSSCLGWTHDPGHVLHPQWHQQYDQRDTHDIHAHRHYTLVVSHDFGSDSSTAAVAPLHLRNIVNFIKRSGEIIRHLVWSTFHAQRASPPSARHATLNPLRNIAFHRTDDVCFECSCSNVGDPSCMLMVSITDSCHYLTSLMVQRDCSSPPRHLDESVCAPGLSNSLSGRTKTAGPEHAAFFPRARQQL